jgi:hypothetical protein
LPIPSSHAASRAKLGTNFASSFLPEVSSRLGLAPDLALDTRSGAFCIPSSWLRPHGLDIDGRLAQILVERRARAIYRRA